MRYKNVGVAPCSGKTLCSSMGQNQNREVGRGWWENWGSEGCMIISLDADKAFDKIQFPCHGLHMLGPGRSTIWRCGLLGVGVSLWVWARRLKC